MLFFALKQEALGIAYWVVLAERVIWVRQISLPILGKKFRTQEAGFTNRKMCDSVKMRKILQVKIHENNNIFLVNFDKKMCFTSVLVKRN